MVRGNVFTLSHTKGGEYESLNERMDDVDSEGANGCGVERWKGSDADTDGEVKLA